MIHAIFPQLLGPGGVQRLGRSLLQQLHAAAAERGMALRVSSLLDRTDALRADFPSLADAQGAAGSRARLLRRVAAARGATAIVCAHPFQAALAMLVPEAALWTHCHGIEVWRPMPWHRRHALRRSALVTCSSEDTRRNVLARQGVASHRAAVLYPELGARWTEAPTGAREPLILTVTRLATGDRDKHIEPALHAFASIRARHPEWRWLVIGDGDDRARLASIGESLGIGNAVTWAGRVSDEALADAYRRASLFLLPSTKEGFGIVFAEALAAGIAVVAAKAGGAPEAVGPGGWLCAEPTRDAIATCLAEALASDTDRARRAEAGRAHVLAACGPAAFASNVRACLARLLGEAP